MWEGHLDVAAVVDGLGDDHVLLDVIHDVNDPELLDVIHDVDVDDPELLDVIHDVDVDDPELLNVIHDVDVDDPELLDLIHDVDVNDDVVLLLERVQFVLNDSEVDNDLAVSSYLILDDMLEVPAVVVDESDFLLGVNLEVFYIDDLQPQCGAKRREGLPLLTVDLLNYIT